MSTAPAYTLCNATVTLSAPIRSERVRGFQPPWRTVYVYQCATCKSERRVYANSFRGTRPQPGVGAIVCGAYLPAQD